jgi:hypothetical protein
MTHFVEVIAAALLTGLLFPPPVPAPKSDGFAYIDLQSKANQKLADEFGGRIPNNTLSVVPLGEKKFADVKFKVEKSYLQLGSPVLTKERPDKIEGIKVERMAEKLHFLHSTAFGKAEPKIEDGDLVAEYRIQYADGKVETVKVKYGEDLRDFWYAKEEPNPAPKTREKVAWEGENEASKARNNGIRLYLSTWKNPRVSTRIASIDFVKAADCVAAPFCIAISAE